MSIKIRVVDDDLSKLVCYEMLWGIKKWKK